MSIFIKPVKPKPFIKYFRNLKGKPNDNVNKPLLYSANFKHTKSINIEFNPFDQRCESIRFFTKVISVPKWTKTNQSLAIKNVVKSVSCEPTIYLTFNTGLDLEIKTEHLSCAEIFKILVAYYRKYHEKLDSTNVISYE